MPRPAPVTIATRSASMSAIRRAYTGRAALVETCAGRIGGADAPQRTRPPDRGPLADPRAHVGGMALRFLRPDPLHVPPRADLRGARRRARRARDPPRRF